MCRTHYIGQRVAPSLASWNGSSIEHRYCGAASNSNCQDQYIFSRLHRMETCDSNFGASECPCHRANQLTPFAITRVWTKCLTRNIHWWPIIIASGQLQWVWLVPCWPHISTYGNTAACFTKCSQSHTWLIIFLAHGHTKQIHATAHLLHPKLIMFGVFNTVTFADVVSDNEIP